MCIDLLFPWWFSLSLSKLSSLPGNSIPVNLIRDLRQPEKGPRFCLLSWAKSGYNNTEMVSSRISVGRWRGKLQTRPGNTNHPEDLSTPHHSYQGPLLGANTDKYKYRYKQKCKYKYKHRHRQVIPTIPRTSLHRSYHQSTHRKMLLLNSSHCAGRHFRTKLMSRYIGSGQKKTVWCGDSGTGFKS